jgi:hypothetical protein
MENLHYNLSHEDSPKGWKYLLWIFAAIFFVAGVYLLINNLVMGNESIPAAFAAAPLGISVLVSLVAGFISAKKKDQFFTINDEIIEFRYGFLKARIHSYKWNDVRELILPKRQKKAKLLLTDGSSFIINLNWLNNKKAFNIRKQLYLVAREKGLNVLKVKSLAESK